MWEQENMEPSSLVAADGKLIILELKGVLRIVEATPTSYNELSRINVGDGIRFCLFPTPPVLYKGKIYCRNYPDELICIDVRA